jgi:hypothetical protein
MDKNQVMIDKIIDDLALNKYDSIEDAIEDLIFYGLDPLSARTAALSMDSIDVVPYSTL